jgi:serine/threonine-protein kinase
VDVVLSGRYKLISTLGKGGMGEVWRGLDTMLNRPVAVKLIRLSAAPSAADYDDAVRRFRREAQALAALNHPNIVAAYDFGIDADADADTPYLVMEMIEGRPLTAELADRKAAGEGPLPIGRVLAIAADVCAGLSAAHAAGVIHRDLKPANLMTVASTGRVKIVDFGTARGGGLSRVTQTGLIVGTVAYIAPEMLSSGEVDGRADIYALGCVLYELLTGRGAYDAADPAQFIAAHLHSAPTPLRELLPDAPEALEVLLLDMLAKMPEFRPAGADEVATRLAAALPYVQTIVERPDRTVSIPAPREPSATFVESGDPVADLADGPIGNPARALAELPRTVAEQAPDRTVAEQAPDVRTVAVSVGDLAANSDAGPDETASLIPAQRPPRMPAAPASPLALDNPPSRRPSGRTLAIAGVVVAVVAAAVVWATTSGGGQPTSSPAAATPKSSAVAHTPQATTSSASAPSSALVEVRTMSANPQCGAPSQLSFNSMGTQLAGAGRSSGDSGSAIACVWTVSTGALTYKATGYHKILGAQFDPDDGHLTYVTSGGSVPIQVGAVGATGGSIKGSLSNTTHMKSNLEAVAVSSTGHTIAVSYTDNGTIQFYNMGDHEWITDADGGVVGATGTLTFSPDGSRIAHAETSGVVVVNTGSLSSKAQKTWTGPGASAAAFLGNEEIVTCSGNRVSMYDVTSASTTPKLSATITGNCVGIAVRHGSHDVAVSTSDHGVVLMTLPPSWE